MLISKSMTKAVIMNKIKIDLKIFRFKFKEMMKDAFIKYFIPRDFKEKRIQGPATLESISLLWIPSSKKLSGLYNPMKVF